nr:recombinase family protein [Actinoplanes subtropicus]
MFRGRQVLAVVGPHWPDPPAGRASVVAAAGRLGLHEIGPGWAYAVGGLRVTVIGPYEPLHGTNSDPNNNSLVLRAEIKGETVLLPGDAETEEQDELLRYLGAGALRADVLKVAHGNVRSAPMTGKVRAGIYTRISDDRLGEALGVARQERDDRELAARLGWDVARVFTDNDVSASSGRRRPAYEAMIEAIKAGEIDAVVVWDVDRLTRRPAELEVFIDLAERHGLQLASVGGDIDLATPQGRLTARIKGSVARHEAEQLARRIRAKVGELASTGAIANGGPRPFGFHRVYSGEGPRRKILRDELDPLEAPIVREAARRVLAGDSMGSVIRWLRDSDVRTSTGRTWSQQALRIMLRSGRIAGLREHQGRVVGPAVWPGIITAEEHQQLRAVLDAKTRAPGSRVRMHYLTGFVYCSDCADKGVKMRPCPQAGKLKYKCSTDVGGCNGRVIVLDDLRELIDAYMVARLNDPETLRELAEREAADDGRAGELVDEIEAAERRLKLLKPALEDGDEDELPEVLATVRALRKRIKAARVELGEVTSRPDITTLDLPEMAKRWADLDLDKKQHLLALFVDRIVIGPARRGLARFDPDRVDVIPARRGANGDDDRDTV